MAPVGHHPSDKKNPGDTNAKPAISESLSQWMTAKRRVILLYEDYIHLSPLQQIWSNPVTEKPALEPCFAAAFHGIELCFLLLSEFINDDRKYVFRRPRIELVAHDIQQQCLLLTEVVDGKLEEDTVNVSRASLTQHFPFEACPPTTNQASHSPCLQRLINAIAANKSSMTMAERNSLVKVVLNITNTFDSSFSRWTVGLGIEHQLNELRAAAGLPEEARFRARARNLDYSQLIHPEVVEATLSEEVYEHEEDFFFRTVHLGTECWSFVALNRMAAAQQLAEEGQWHVASARIIQASRMLHYLGDHILMLMSMNLRDYLRLKVEIQGTSGEGSKAVKSFRHHLEKLFQPLMEAITYHDASDSLPTESSLSPRMSCELEKQPQLSPRASSGRSHTVTREYSLPKPESSRQHASPTTTGKPDSASLDNGKDNGDTHALTPSHYDSQPSHEAMLGQPSGSESQQGSAPQQDTTDDSYPHHQNMSQQSHQPSTAQQGVGQQPHQAPAPEQDVCQQLHHTSATQQPVSQGASAGKQATLDSLLEIYEEPDAYAGLYNYAKALEDVEAGLLAGFFFKHYCLASNVIGSQSKGTGYMRSTSKAIVALKATFQTPVFPLLDAVRCALNSKIDEELAHLKGRIMDNIEAKRAQADSGSQT